MRKALEDIELHGSLPWGMANEPPWMARRQQPLPPSPKPVVTIDQMQCMEYPWVAPALVEGRSVVRSGVCFIIACTPEQTLYTARHTGVQEH